MQRNHRKQQASEIRFLQVQIPKNAVARSSDIDAKDHIQSMKQNIELMEDGEIKNLEIMRLVWRSW